MPIYQNTNLGIPGTYTFVNPNGLQIKGLNNASSVLLVGSSVGGTPGTLLQPTDPTNASNVLVGGDLLNAFNFTSQGGAGSIYAWRVDPATPSTLTVFGANGDPSFIIQSTDAGAYTRQISVAISGTVGNQTATVINGYTGQSMSASNLGPAFTVQYTGNATQATGAFTTQLSAPVVTLTSGTTGSLAAGTYAVYVAAKNAASLTLSAPVSGTVVASGTLSAAFAPIVGAAAYDVYVSGTSGISFVQSVPATAASTQLSVTINQIGTTAILPAAASGPAFVGLLAGQTDGSQNLNLAVSTAGTLVNTINVQQGYSASLASATAGLIPGSLLDPSGSLSLLGTPGGQFTANTGAIISWINSISFVTATPSTPLNPPAALLTTNLVGGQDGTPTVADWQAAANAIQTMTPPPRYIVALTDLNAFIAPLFQAVTANASTYPPVFSELYIGGSTTPTVASESARSAAFGNHRVINAGWCFNATNVTGSTQLFPGYMLGALYAGIRASLPVADALTNKLLPIQSLGLPLSSTDVATLIANNVAVPMVNAVGQIVISRGVTTSPNHTQIYDREESVLNVSDSVRWFLIQHTTSATSGIIGAPNYGANTVKARIGYINGLLDKTQALGWIAGFQKVTALTPLQGNPEYEVAQLTIYVPIPTNGMVYQINLSVPVGL